MPMFLQRDCLQKNPTLLQNKEFFTLHLITFKIEQLACVRTALKTHLENGVLQPSPTSRLCTIYRSHLLVRVRDMGACCPARVNNSYMHFTIYRLLMVTRKFKQKAADVTLPGVRLISPFTPPFMGDPPTLFVLLRFHFLQMYA